MVSKASREMATDWSREEVAATVADYFAMLAAELSGVPYNKAAHRRALIKRLSVRSAQSVEFKHANISAVLIDLGFPYITGYKPRSNYQGLLHDVVSERLVSDSQLLNVAAADADRPIVVPEVEDILGVLTTPPAMQSGDKEPGRGSIQATRACISVNYLEREARNRSLGTAGELFVLNFERARLINLGKERLAEKVEHTSQTRGDGAGFDILSYEETGADRLIEVKTTKYGRETPFFVSRNELAVSESEASRYYLYRLFGFNVKPRLFTLAGAFSESCRLSPSSYLASVI
ncbi:DUF3883 domain-containing protein [Synechococcus sp. Cruz-9H2]|uniref:DUF3883 domain-containing protein n=2 Tax=Synechococcus TaxID=1129 RepID=UPI0020CD5B0E|nr:MULTISPECIES: DUF3883 domain-containing protein [unclassified Synechococcus]MCP9819401.1 DUF3883 domain-containing protein [Synechococcus sp. Cruz-9H2]MCP9854939.1 DUF3883 domain-containing protein [Synechococcus sp. Cruz-9C9]MCP9870311.1 DUF3883 domain-containing protein [Synechococcus sp. Cruz-7B9]